MSLIRLVLHATQMEQLYSWKTTETCGLLWLTQKPGGGVRQSDCLRLITAEWEDEVHRGDAEKTIRLYSGCRRTSGSKRVYVGVRARCKVYPVREANPVLMNVWDVRMVVEPRSQSARYPPCSLRASSVPDSSTCLSLFLTPTLFKHSWIVWIKRRSHLVLSV